MGNRGPDETQRSGRPEAVRWRTVQGIRRQWGRVVADSLQEGAQAERHQEQPAAVAQDGQAVRKRHRHARPDLDLIDIESVHAADLVATDRLDIAVASAFDDPTPAPRDLAAHHLLDDPLVLVLPEEHPVAQDTAPDELVQLNRFPRDAWIAILAGAAARRQFDRLAEQSGITPDIRFETGSYDVAQALVGTGVAIAIVSRMAVRELPGTTYRPIAAERAARRIEAITLRDAPFTPLVDEFLGLLLDVAEDLVSSWRRW